VCMCVGQFESCVYLSYVVTIYWVRETDLDFRENDIYCSTMSEQQVSQVLPITHSPALAGSVISASDGLGGSAQIRVQNISSTGTRSRLDLSNY